MSRILFILALLSSFAAVGQIYKFNRQLIINYSGEKTRNLDYWVTPIEVEVTSKKIILRRPPNGSGEKEICDTLIRSKTTNKKDFKKIQTKDGRLFVIWNDQYITMVTKEQKGARVEYVFYNQEKNEE